MSSPFMRQVKIYVLTLLLLALAACTTTPPVQEMSNARQTIAAALEARAKVFAPAQLAHAERLMSQATGALESGDYKRARAYAVAAQQQAMKARTLSVSQQQKN